MAVTAMEKDWYSEYKVYLDFIPSLPSQAERQQHPNEGEVHFHSAAGSRANTGPNIHLNHVKWNY
jgi:hypothetical protein